MKMGIFNHIKQESENSSTSNEKPVEIKEEKITPDEIATDVQAK